MRVYTRHDLNKTWYNNFKMFWSCPSFKHFKSAYILDILRGQGHKERIIFRVSVTKHQATKIPLQALYQIKQLLSSKTLTILIFSSLLPPQIYDYNLKSLGRRCQQKQLLENKILTINKWLVFSKISNNLVFSSSDSETWLLNSNGPNSTRKA